MAATNDGADNSGRKYLEEHPGATVDPATVTQAQLQAWLAEDAEPSRGTARIAYVVGRALLAQRKALKHGEVAEWEEATASAMQRSVRSVRLYMQVARIIDSPSNRQRPLPISALERPLREVPVAIRNQRAGRPLDQRPPRREKAPTSPLQRWVGRADSLIRDLAAVRSSLQDPSELAEFDRELNRLFATWAGAVAEARGGGGERPEPQPKVKAGPLVGYPGGKFALWDRIRLLDVPPHLRDEVGGLREIFGKMIATREYREPFIGGGSVGLNVVKTFPTARAWFNDGDPGIGALWKAVFGDHRALIGWVEAHPKDSITRDLLWEYRGELAAGSVSGIELAGKALAVQQCAFNNYGRMAGLRQEQFLADKWNPGVRIEKIHEAHNLVVGRARLTNLDFEEVIREPGDCILYVDPPYVEQGPALYPYHFEEPEHRRLAKALHETDQPWLLSYDDHPLVREMYADCAIKRITFKYGSKKGGKLKKGIEVLVCPRAWSSELLDRFEDEGIFELFGDDALVLPVAAPSMKPPKASPWVERQRKRARKSGAEG